MNKYTENHDALLDTQVLAVADILFLIQVVQGNILENIGENSLIKILRKLFFGILVGKIFGSFRKLGHSSK